VRAIGENVPRESGVKREDCIPFSGGATGTEAAFAPPRSPRLDEVNFTFEGHNPYASVVGAS